MKKWVLAVLFVLVLSVTASAMVRIGITAIVDHPALDSAREGVIELLIKKGLVKGKDFDVEFQSAQGNISTAVSIANYFNTNGFDIVVAISTPSAQSCMNAIKTFPVVFSAVTDPVAASLVPALGKNPGNVVGVSDMTPVKTQFQLLKFVVPDVKKVGIVTNPGEANSIVITEHARAACEELGLTLVEVVGSNTSEMISALSAMVDDLDALYVGTDNTAASCIESLHRITVSKKVPMLCGDFNTARDGGVMAYGFDYFSLGMDTGTIVWDIIQGKSVSEIDSRLMNADSLLLLLNLDVAKEIGLTFPESVKNRADFIIENGVENKVLSR
jgi:putative ABC transport system substrate-binding protein